MKHWHQCVKYTLPQCSFQFIFLLVSYVYKKRAAKKKEVTKGDQSLSDDWGWHFVILSLAREGPSLIPCINTSFIFCHHRLHCTNDVMTRPRGIPAAAQSALATPNTARPNPWDASVIWFPGGGCLLRADEEDPEWGWGQGSAILNFSCPFKQERDLLFSCPKIEYFLDGWPAKAKFLFLK